MASPPGLSGISVGWPAGSSSGVGCTGRSGGDWGSIVSGFGLGSGSGLLAMVFLLGLSTNGRAEAMHAGVDAQPARRQHRRSEEHTSELQSLMRISYAVFCLKKKKKKK